MRTPKAQLDLARKHNILRGINTIKKHKTGSHHPETVGCSENHSQNSNLSKEIAAPSKMLDAAIAISWECFSSRLPTASADAFQNGCASGLVKFLGWKNHP